MNRTVLTSFAILCLLSTVFLSGLAFEIQSVKAASETIYIRADGSIDPPTAPISTVDNVTYTFTDNIHDEIVVERDNIVVDGLGYTLHGTGFSWPCKGIDLTGRSNVTIKNVEIKMFWYGIYLYESSNNTISGNNITTNQEYGISLYASFNNSISNNNIKNNGYQGVDIFASSFNVVFRNNITMNNFGVGLSLSSFNIVSGNNIDKNIYYGIELSDSSNEIVSENNIKNNDHGIGVFGASFNIISNNIIGDNNRGIGLYYSSNSNNVSRNNIKNNGAGLCIAKSSDNVIYHNSFFNNTLQAKISEAGYANIWDNGYPSGGNYWSDYTGVDLYSGPYQNETGYDWIGDSPYVIDQNNIDRYPLMHPFVPEMEEIRIAYRNLLLKYDELQEQIDLLNSTCKKLQESISNLISTFNSTRDNLQGQINSLNQTCISLNQSIINLQGQLDLVNGTFIASISNLQEQQKALSNQVNTIQNTLYVFAALIVFLIVAIVYVAIRKPKTETKTEKETEAQ